MDINILDAHDRLKDVHKKNSLSISEMCEKIINERPFGDHPFYLFVHKRTIDFKERATIYNQDLYESFKGLPKQYKDMKDVPSHRLIWQPRLTKPKAQTNSMLFKAYPGTDIVKTIWMIPERELWPEYKKGNLTADETVTISIDNFLNNRKELEAKEEDDLDDKQIQAIYRNMATKKRLKQELLVPFF